MTDWMKLAAEAYDGSTSYFDTNIRRQVESNMRQFQSKHPSNSKYLSETYRHRSRLFRPKTRALVRSNEAVAASAFFANQDAVSISAPNDDDPEHQASALLMKELIEYRLSHSIPWFQIVIGAYQDAMVAGVVASYQYWQYDEVRKIDKPCIELIPIENLRFDPAADWTDPINSSPYLIRLIPMYIKDVKARMATDNIKAGEPKWMPLEDGVLLSATKTINDSTRQVREGQRVDSKGGSTSTLNDFQIVWVHQNFIEVDGSDFIFFTLGTEHQLSEPVPITDQYAHGHRPIVLGCSVIEPHKVYPTSPVEIVKELQAEINEIANQRIDNVKLAMNKRYFVKRTAQADIRSLVRNVSGSVTLMNNPMEDVRVIETNDVTASSYKEQEIMGLEFDEVGGNFSGSSVQSNRKLNETVGGMKLLAQDADAISEYQLRTFVETWVEPVIRQLVMLEQKYETDEEILQYAGNKADLVQKYGVYEITNTLIEKQLLVRVNVGLGSSNPQDQFEKFVAGMDALIKIMSSEIAGELERDEVVKELFGKIGYRDGMRFLSKSEDPKVHELTKKVQELETALEAKQPKALTEALVRKAYAEAGKITAEATKVQVESQYEAIQAAVEIGSIPGVGAVADEILLGAGYAMEGGADLSDTPVLTPPEGQPMQNSNTSPTMPPVAPSPLHGIEAAGPNEMEVENV